MFLHDVIGRGSNCASGQSSLRACDKAFLNRRDMFASSRDGANHIKYIIDALASRELAQDSQEDAWNPQPISKRGHRCIGTAVEVALSLIECRSNASHLNDELNDLITV